ncbi:hypothetical protein ACFSC6_15780 [Rufibacter sediminis]|uniref:Lipocalin-like domain-containing protein n=1 Tax=Rufibacter sediminis TaxID=2762756 RepID=A0ABR6VWH4_9BACT|nr:hypothetical protein [Rufibacter sediminis]MBC3541496.1 hypothetical protein [Rufibacter sediminis]
MKIIPRFLLLLMAVCTWLMFGCDQEEDDPASDLALLYGKWKVVRHEGKPLLTAGRPAPVGPFYKQPFQIEGGDSLFWQFHQDNLLTVTDPYMPLITAQMGVGEIVNSDSVSFDMRERPFQWTYNHGLLELQERSPRSRFVVGGQYKIEQLTNDSLVLEHYSALHNNNGTVLPYPVRQKTFTYKVRLARLR